ncbi:hypothetical protein [Massilia pseudoviolaceinigra]|uniref:hypothetical protein n=1 Tax=Massilia pseudoviolaceinigra TaxID=3057165 RepID=UPI002796AE5F|nr:hypothetical protein [Massilia sp. CCM 9206]MDQ1923319.1 hypothetical protein [Massilia sp. CCM 9206]
MPSFRYLLAPLAACLLLSGCLMNSTRPLPSGGTPSFFWRAVVVYGIGMEGTWDAQRFAVELEEYSLADQAITGGCLFYNRTEGSIPSVPGPVQYVAFDVPAGNYAYGRLIDEPSGKATAFNAPAGRIVYLGDFIYTREKRMELRRDLKAFEQVRKQALPDLKGEIALAETQTVARPRFFYVLPDSTRQIVPFWQPHRPLTMPG